MTKLLVLSDSGVPSGYGRITDEIMTRLTRRGYEIVAASIAYDGLLPPVYEGARLPYHVAALGPYMATGNWLEKFTALTAAVNPDVVMVVQDAPYAEAVAHGLDRSKYGFVVITPVDGKPIFPAWVQMLKSADGVLSISQFGVDAQREAGIRSELCRPGIDPNVFFRLPDGKRAEIRAKLGIAPDAFVLGTCAQNQGRKDYPHMLEAFFRFAQDKPDARYLINGDPVSPAGWDLLQVCQQQGWDTTKIIWRHQCEAAGVLEMRERYNVMDAHVVLAHREGFGLPLVEAQACGVVSMALDWCSGTEICGDGHGALIKPVDYVSYSTWGGALDKHPDMHDFAAQLQHLYDQPDARKMIAAKGMARARLWTWDGSVDNVATVIERVVEKRRVIPPVTTAPISPPAPPPPHMEGEQSPVRLAVDGLQPTQIVQLQELLQQKGG